MDFIVCHWLNADKGVKKSKAFADVICGWSLGEGRDAQADVLHGLVVILAAVVGREEVLGAERGRRGQVPLEGVGVDPLCKQSRCESSGSGRI